jgi:hypothetical protein
MSRFGRNALWPAVLSQLLLVGCLAAMARVPVAPSLIAAGFAICFVPYAFILWAAPSRLDPRASKRLALIALGLCGASLLGAPPTLSDDVYRYLWEGRVWAEGYSPYALSPQSVALAPLRDEIWARVNHRNLASIYPPIAQALFALFHFLGGQIFWPKLLALLTQVAATLISTRACDDVRAPLMLGLNPLLLAEGPLAGHLDLLVGVALWMSLWALGKNAIVRAAWATLAAIGLKLVGLVTLPLFWRRPAVLGLLCLGSAALLGPMFLARAPSDPDSGPGQFAMRWRGNESVYALVERGVTELLEAAWGQGDGQIQIRGFDEAVRGTSFDPRRFTADPDKGIPRSDVVKTSVLAAPLTRLVVLLGVMLLAVVLALRGIAPLVAGRAVLWATLLLSPQMHPWYLAWLLPIEIACGGLAGLVWSASVLCAYAPLDEWIANRSWNANSELAVAEYAPVAAAWLWEWTARSSENRVNTDT